MGTLHTLPLRERPAARLSYVGSASMSQVELLALLIGGPDPLETAHAVVQRFGPTLPHALTEELLTIAGIGAATAARIHAALELGRRFARPAPLERPRIHAPADAAAILLPAIGAAEQECFAVLTLDTRHGVIDREVLYQGTLNSTVVRPAEVFRGAVRRNAAAVLVGHNHPSHDPAPSPEDLALTRTLVQAGRTLDLDLVDHLIVSAGRWVSLRQDCGACWCDTSGGYG